MPIRFATILQLMLVVMLGMAGAGCQVIGDIFQAGMWVGVIGVVLVIAVVGFAVSRLRR
jgi:energy-converting hydrogenase Eha subunit H